MARTSSAGYGAHCGRFPLVRRRATWTSPTGLVRPSRCVRSRRPVLPTPLRLSSLATGLYALMEGCRDIDGVWNERGRSWLVKARDEHTSESEGGRVHLNGWGDLGSDRLGCR